MVLYLRGPIPKIASGEQVKGNELFQIMDPFFWFLENFRGDMLAQLAITLPLGFIKKLLESWLLRKSRVLAMVAMDVGGFVADKRRLDI
jgi:hypothetical protein